MRLVLIISVVFVFTHGVWGQNAFKDLKSLEKRADRHYKEMSYMTAIELYKQMLLKPKYKTNNKVRIKIANAYLRIGQSEESESYYREAISYGFVPGKTDSIQFARILINNNKYSEAKLWLKSANDQSIDPLGFAQYKSLSGIQAFYRDSFSFSVKPIIYNSEYADYAPVFYKDGIIFSSDRPTEKLIKQVNLQKDAGFSELYFFKEKDTIQRPAQFFSMDLKTSLHKGPALFYDKGNKVILTANSLKGNTGKLQMFMAEWDDRKKEWVNFQPFAFNSEFYSVGHPALSKDERTLYFVSDMPGGNGGTDIYVSVMKAGEWSKPKNIREPINTEGNEMFPYISPSGKFYFSSDGQGGLGGLDLYYLDHRIDQGSSIINLGYPLNSSGDDFGIILDDKEKSGYFSSNRKGGKGEDDIYKLYIKQIEFKLKITDEIASASLVNPKIILVDKETEEEIRPMKVFQAKENVLNYVLKPSHEYKVTVQKDDYKDFEKEISTVGINDEQVIEMKVVLKRKFEYYVTLKIRDAETENIVENSHVRLINLSTLELDSLGINSNGELDIKLDAEADYLLLAYKNNKYGEVLVDKPGKKKVSSVRYTTLHLEETEVKKNKFTVLDSLGKEYSNAEVIIRDMITGKEQKVSTDEKGELWFALPRAWYFRIYYNNRTDFYDSLTKGNTGSLKFK
jgi:hypothetical protein